MSCLIVVIGDPCLGASFIICSGWGCGWGLSVLTIWVLHKCLPETLDVECRLVGAENQVQDILPRRATLTVCNTNSMLGDDSVAVVVQYCQICVQGPWLHRVASVLGS